MIHVSPDIEFIEKLQAVTGSQLTTCMQCGACTASCTLSSDQDVFPRKQMIMAAWGMKDKLMADPFVWTCHQCGDCSLTCPRGVEPGEVLTALRQEQIAYYSRPRFLARWMQKPAFLPAALLFPAVVITLILILAGTFSFSDFSLPEGPVDYGEFFPHGWLNGSFTALFILSTIGIVIGLKKFSRNVSQNKTAPENRTTDVKDDEAVAADIEASPGDKGVEGGSSDAVRSLPGRIISVLGRIMSHRDFNSCGEQKGRSITHFLVFWGFILLLFVTFFAILSTIFWEYPLGFFNPIKLAGNLGAIMLLAGSSIMILNRLIRRKGLQSTYSDWFFLVSFWLLTFSGMLVEGARFHEWGFAYHLYFIHLVLVWIIILYYPYTKFSHFLYRTVAMVLARLR